MHEWLVAVERELGLEGAVDSEQGFDSIDDLSGRVDQQVSAVAARRTAFLVGIAAGRAEEPAVAAGDFARKLGAMAQGWDVEAERGVPSNDQNQRG